jgi:hypothetical protein
MTGRFRRRLRDASGPARLPGGQKGFAMAMARL